MSTQTAETDKFEHAKANADGWYQSIIEMMQALGGHEKAAIEEGWTGPLKDKFGVTYFKHEDGATWACATWKELCEQFDIYAEPDENAMQTIQESVLSVTVRDGWHQPGVPSEGAEEYEILLTTGGPALRIYGELDDYGQPRTAELQMQDWFTPWTHYPSPQADLLRFASCFYFGE